MASKRRGRGVDPTGRSKRGGRFIQLPHLMTGSAAWRSLSPAAVKVFIELRRRFNGGNNGDLSLSLEEGKRLLGLGKTTIARALAELVAVGLVKKTGEGDFYRRLAATYAMTDFHHGTHGPTNDWQRWSPPAAKTERGPERERHRPATGPSG